MYIKLTNASPALKGNPIVLKTEMIHSAHRSTVTRENGDVDTVTMLFCPPHGQWEVLEPLDTVASMMHSSSTTGGVVTAPSVLTITDKPAKKSK